MTQPANQPECAGQSEVSSATENALRAENTTLKELITGMQARIAELETKHGETVRRLA